MWTRAELKMRAKANLRKYFWPALAVSMVCSLFNSEGGGNAGVGANAGMNAAPETINGDLGSIVSEIPQAAEGFIDSFDPVVSSVVLIGVLIGLAIGLAVGIFVAPPIEVGKNRFYMESRAAGYSAGMDCLIWGFKNHYLNIVWTMFLRGLIVFLGTFCFIIPGIYFAYCYYMVPYILAENPDMKATDALRMSKDMMAGHKLSTWVLELSFFGWWIVGAMACGIGTFLVYPYYDATFAELYAVLRERFSNYLNGFGYQTAGDGYYDNYSYGQYNNWQQPYQESYQQPYQAPYQEMNGSYANQETFVNVEQDTQPAERGGEVKRSEGGPGRGYYLNGVFHPYTDEELDELERNKK